MSSLRSRLIDRNRFAKRYPFVKAPKRESYLGTSKLAMELGSLTFNNEDEKIFEFEVAFDDTNYHILAMPREVEAVTDGSAQVTLAIDGNTIDKSQVKIKASAKFTGKVDVLAIKLD